MSKIIYLEPRGRGSFRSGLRSDTLWGSICWAIRYLQDAKAGRPLDIENTVNSYPPNKKDKPEIKKDFYLSSAFPWYENQGKNRVHYLPNPLLANPSKKVGFVADAWLAKVAVRRQKITQKRPDWISWANFSALYGADNDTLTTDPSPYIQAQAVTHNLIDRSRLGTLTTKNEGQLFHMNENQLRWRDPDGLLKPGFRSGFYFFLSGNDELVLPALRLLSTLGIGGDRTNGKGSFAIYWEADTPQLTKNYQLPPLADANASLCLSLYRPARYQDELGAYAQTETGNWQYQLEDRQGRNVNQGDYLQDGLLYFKEGSIFPKNALSTSFPGQNLELGKHRLRHEIHRYGHAFMIDLKL